MRPPTTPSGVQETHVSTDVPSSDPRASLVRAIGSVARNGDIDTILAGILAAAADSLSPSMGAVFVQDPDRPGLHLVAASAWTTRRRRDSRPRSPIRRTHLRPP